MGESANQRAQREGDTGANEAARIRQRESDVRTAWRTFVYHNECNPSAATLAALTGYPRVFVAMICERSGYQLVEE